MARTRARWKTIRGRRVYIINGVEEFELLPAYPMDATIPEGTIVVLEYDKLDRPVCYGRYEGRHEGKLHRPGQPKEFRFKMVACTGDRCDNGRSLNLEVYWPAGLLLKHSETTPGEEKPW